MQYALIYCRVSSERQAKEGHGLDSQEYRCREYAKSKGYEVAAVFRDSFTGAGDFMKREGMVNLLHYIDKYAHKSYVVIFDDLSRFARDVTAHIRLRQEFDRREVKIACPNFTFEDTPEGELVENIMAAQNQYHRKHNRRQVIQKQKARLEEGFWPFNPPPGYTQVKDPVHGKKILTPVEPKASLIREAFEGYASGRFASQSDVLRFLKRAGYGEKMYPEGIRRLFRRIVYAGYVQRREWDVSRRKGHHQALVSLETFEKVQARLNGFYKTRERKTDNPDFALRGFVLCSSCRRCVTASWSQGSTKRYRFYRCNTPACERYNKSVNGDVLDAKFADLLRSISPREEAINLAKAVLLDLWSKRLQSMDGQRVCLEKKLMELRSQVDGLADRVSKTVDERMVRIYEQKILAMEQEKVDLEGKLLKVGSDAVGFETALEVVAGFLKDPFIIWENGGLNAKRSVLRLIFADKLAYHAEMGFETAQKSPLVGIFEQLPAKKSQDVEMGGIEPPCK